MIEPAPAEAQPLVRLASACPWLDYLRGAEGPHHPACRLTAHVFPAGALDQTSCLSLCTYPAQHHRGRCKHMDLTNVLRSGSDPPLPRILCRAHVRYDAPGFCAKCPDYEQT